MLQIAVLDDYQSVAAGYADWSPLPEPPQVVEFPRLRGRPGRTRRAAGAWQQTVGTDLAGGTLGVLGLGRLGARVATIGRAFRMDVVAWSQNLTDERAREVGAPAGPEHRSAS